MATKLKLLIVSMDRSQIDLARQAEIGESRLSRIVRGWVDPTSDEVRRLAEALGVDVVDIGTRSDHAA